MILDRLTILNYKNIREADLSFSHGINCLIGDNGMGKTNLLDAIYYLSFTKSHNMTTDTQNITIGEDVLMLRGSYIIEGKDKSVELHCGIKKRQGRVFKRDGQEYEKISDHIGELPLVIVSPSDMVLISGSAEDRRKFVNGLISQYDKKYLDAYLSYQKAMSQRNALLRSESNDELQYEMWEEIMVSASEYIYDARRRFIVEFVPLFQHYYEFISDNKEFVGFDYKPYADYNAGFDSLFKSNRNKDLVMGYTTAGVHRDDLMMTLAEMPIRKCGSQGQCKTFLTALKMAQYIFLRKISKRTPILLLDDIFDKLDANRVSRIISLIRDDDKIGQIFITDTDRQHTTGILKDSGAEHCIFDVVNGEFSKESE